MKAQLSLNNVSTAVDTFATVAERIMNQSKRFPSYYRAHFKSKYIIVMEHDVHIYTDGAAKGILEMAVTAL
jgi:hypothetical protein